MKLTPPAVCLLWAFFALWACESPPVAPLSEPPTARAGQDLRSEVRDTIVLDGTDSNSSDNSPLNYSWAQVDGPSLVFKMPAADGHRLHPSKRESTYSA